MINKKHHVYNLIILDESGSMKDIKKPTISGFNEVVETIKDVEKRFPEQKHYISLVCFNGRGIKELLWNVEVEKLSPLNEELYQPDHVTPLYDAIVMSVSRLKEDLPHDITSNVLVTILTDGIENASQVYSRKQVRELIEELKQKSWTFAYIGANHNVEDTARNISITNTLRFSANDDDVSIMFSKEKKARIAMAMKMSAMKKNEPIQFNKDFYKDDEYDKEE